MAPTVQFSQLFQLSWGDSFPEKNLFVLKLACCFYNSFLTVFWKVVRNWFLYNEILFSHDMLLFNHGLNKDEVIFSVRKRIEWVFERFSKRSSSVLVLREPWSRWRCWCGSAAIGTSGFEFLHLLFRCYHSLILVCKGGCVSHSLTGFLGVQGVLK